MNSDALDALYSLDPSMVREQWIRVAFAAKDAGITEAEWLDWSERGSNFDRADALSTFRNAKPRAGGVTAATLFMMARDAGYRPEQAKPGNGGNGQAHPMSPPRDKPAQVEPPPTDPLPVWNACRTVDVHPYLSKKAIKPHGARVSATGALVVPYYNRERLIQTIQTIAADGTKRFLAGAKAKGSVAICGEPADAAVIVVAEGFATAAAIAETTGYASLAAGSRVSLPEGARIARHFSAGARVVIAADRGDLSTPMSAARGIAGFLACPGPEDAADGFDFADWRLAGATDVEIRARIDRAAPVPTGDDAEEQPITHRRPAARTVAKPPRAASPGDVGPYILDGRGNIVTNLSNVFAYLASGATGDLRRDTFTGVVTWKGAPVTDATYLAITRAVQHSLIDGRMPFTKCAVATVVDAVHDAAESNSYNSSVEWLEGLTWDGTARIERFFPTSATSNRRITSSARVATSGRA